MNSSAHQIKSIKGRVKEIIRGPVVSWVNVETARGILTSIVAKRSIRRLGLKVSTEVIAGVSPTEVSLAKP